MATMEKLFCVLKKTQASGTGTPNAILDMVQEWKGMGENLYKSLVDCFSDIESREQTLKSVRESLEKHLKDLEEKERKFDSFQERKNEELKLREEKLDEQLKLVHEHIESLEVSQSEVEGLRLRECEKLKEIEKREREIDLFRESLEKQLREVEKREKEFDTFNRINSEKLRELTLKEELLSRKKKEFVEEVKLVDEKLREKQKLGLSLIERLELALNMLEGMKVKLEERFKEMESWETLSYESLSEKANEADLIRESLEKRFKEFEKIGKENNLFPEEKARNLDSKEQHIGTLGIEDKGQQLGCRTREVELEENVDDIQDLKQSESTGASITIPQESVDLKRLLLKDGNTLEMFLNGTNEDLELMDDEIFKILLLSSDPAKFVLDALGGFYTSHSGKDYKELRLRRVCILLLDQLTKMSPDIQPCVRESAAKLALEWKSAMIPTADNQLEVLGFLHLLAAYNLSSYFDKNELLSFVKSLAQHKQTPELCRILGLTEKIPGFIQNLINEKQYLLASTYIYECGLENMFPQATVLNYYVQHVKLSAKAKCRWECRSSKAPDKAIASEIADLCVVIEHIVKYGLESEYSPDILTARIKQLERNQASLRYTSPSSAADIPKQGKRKICFWDADNRQHEEAKEAATDPKAQMPLRSRYYPAWKVKNLKRETERYPVGFHKHRNFVDEMPMPHPRKKRRKNCAPFEH